MSLSRISAESSQIFWRAPNAPWRQKEDMRHMEAQTTEIGSDPPGMLKSRCRQRSAETVLNFIWSFFWWSWNLAMRNVRWCLMWPQLINQSTAYNVLRAFDQDTFECSTVGLTPPNRRNPTESPMVDVHIPNRLETSVSFPDMQSEKQIWHITDTDAVWCVFPWKPLPCQHSFEMRYTEHLREKKILWRRHDALIWSARLRLRQGQKQKETQFCC